MERAEQCTLTLTQCRVAVLHQQLKPENRAELFVVLSSLLAGPKFSLTWIIPASYNWPLSTESQQKKRLFESFKLHRMLRDIFGLGSPRCLQTAVRFSVALVGWPSCMTSVPLWTHVTHIEHTEEKRRESPEGAVTLPVSHLKFPHYFPLFTFWKIVLCLFGFFFFSFFCKR